MVKLNIIVEHSKDGYFAFCPELKGCFSQGETIEEANTNIHEAIELYLETLTPEKIAEFTVSSST